MILVDTSAWILYFQNNNLEIDSFIKSKMLCTIDIIIMEFLQGIKNDKNHNIIKEWFLSIPNFKIEQNDYLKASEIYRNCRKKGTTIRKSIDCIISSIAIRYNLTLVGNDSDFENIAKVYNLNYKRLKGF